MTITGGFGTQIDITTGRARRWYMRGDGIKRWADNDAPIEKSASLPDDVERCIGVSYDGEWREGCEDCLRRAAPPMSESMIEPPTVIVFECPFRIEPDDRRPRDGSNTNQLRDEHAR